MVQKKWMQTIDSSVCALYVQPLNPKKGDKVSISLQAKVDEDLVSMQLVCYQHGSETYVPMSLAAQKGGHCFYTAEMELVDEVLRYYFLLIARDRAYSYSKLGVKAFFPPLSECFYLKSDLKVVDWVGSSTCYQIFPDRFRNGDPSVGAKEGEYSFDGSQVTVHGFDEIPLEFEKGRCLDFFNGDLKGIEQSINHFKKLGVNVLYLNPIGASRTTHRYDCIDFFQVDEKLGGNSAFASLCDALHANGMRIIVDISINHTGTDHTWYQKALSDPDSEEASFYYIDEDGSATFWQDVPTLPQLNYNSDVLRDLMYRKPDSVLQTFLRKPYLQDGWRLDVANEVGRNKTDQLCEEIWREVRTSLKQEHEQVYLVGENWIDSTPFLQGDMWDATMNYFGCGRLMRSWMGECDRFLTEGWGQKTVPTRAFEADEFAQALQSHLNSVPAQMLSMQMNLINSHDTPRLYENLAIFDFQLFKGVMKLLYVLPGMPSIYYGEEIALAGPNVSVESSRYPMQWDEKRWKGEFYKLYTALGDFRQTYGNVLKDGAWRILFSDEYCLAFARYDMHLAILCVLSKKEQKSELSIPNDTLQISQILESEALQTHVQYESLSIVLEAKGSALIVGKRYT